MPRSFLALLALMFLSARSLLAQFPGGCETYILITQYPASPAYSTSANITVEYGDLIPDPNNQCLSYGGTNPSTFRFYLNGVDITSRFSVGGNQAVATNVTLADETTNGLVAAIMGNDLDGNARQDVAGQDVFVDTTPAPNVSTAPYSPNAQDAARCAVACFAATWAQSTVPYYTLGAPRSVTLVYNSDRAPPRPFVHVDVTHPAGTLNPPTEFRLSVQVYVANQWTNRPFLNNESTLRFTGSSQTVRLGGQLDVSDLATGAYPLRILVSSYYAAGGGSLATTQTDARLVVVNELSSAIARGWTVAGIQRLTVQSDTLALIAEGDGSAVVFHKPCGTCSFATPLGEFSSFAVSGNTYVRVYPDSTRVTFDATGRMVRVADRFGNRDSVIYDGSGRLFKLKDPIDSTITLAYDANGLDYIQDTFGRVTQVTVSGDGDRQLLAITDPDNVATSFTYSPTQKRLDWVTDRRGQRDVEFGYHTPSNKVVTLTGPSVSLFDGSTGRPQTTLTPWQFAGVPYGSTSTPVTPPRADTVRATVADPAGHATRFTVNAFGQPLQTTRDFGDTVTIAYSGDGQPTQILDRLGVSSSYVYSAGGFLSWSSVGSVETNYRYAGWAQADSISGQGAAQRLFLNPANGRVDSVRIGGRAGQTPSQQTMIRYTYDTRGRLLTVRDSMNAHLLARHWYDAPNGNRSKDSVSTGAVASYGYDTYGRPRTVAVTGQPIRTTDYDLVNRPTQFWDGVNANPTVIRYDALLDTSVTDPRGQTYRFGYNELGWLVRQTDPLGVSATLGYDRDGLVRRSTNRRGQSIDVTYDALHRRLIRTGAGIVPDTLTYSGNGRVITAANAASRNTAYLNGRLQPDSVKTVLTVPGGAPQTYTQRYSYTYEGWLASTWVTGAFSSLTRQYAWRPNVGVLDSLRFGASAWTRFFFNPDLVATVTRFSASDSISRGLVEGHGPSSVSGPGFYESYGYDALARINRVGTGTLAARREFGYDNLGRLGSTSFIGPITGCGFNPRTGLQCSGGTVDSTHGFSYDEVGNRLDHVGGYTTGNRITAFDGCGYGTDADGGVTARTNCGSQSATFAWSADGLLTSYAVNGTTYGFAYDAAGRLVRRDMNGTAQRYFLWDGPSLVAELGAGGTSRVAEYSYYPGGLDNLHAIYTGGYYFAKTDALGNVRVLTDGNGAVKRTYNYDEWGRLYANSTDNVPLNSADRARWKGALWMGPELELYYMRNRWYEPGTGRFLSEDPIGLGGGVNQYAFGAGDPTNSIDPSGLNHCLLKDFIKDLCTPDLDPIQVTAPADPWWGNDPAESGYWPYGPGPGGAPGPGGGSPEGPGPEQQKPEKPCDNARLVAGGLGGFGSAGRTIISGPLGSHGPYATTAGEGGHYTTRGTAYGLGGGFGWDVNFVGTRGSFGGPSQGFCGALVLVSACWTWNSSGNNVSFAVGPAVGIVYVKTNTVLTPVVACKP